MLGAATAKLPSEVEVRAVAPFASSDQADAKLRHPLPGNVLGGRYTQGVQETLSVLVDLRERGAFIPNKGQHCSHCRFQPACRRYHPPTVERTRHSGVPQVRRFLKLQDKSTRQATLSPGEGEEA